MYANFCEDGKIDDNDDLPQLLAAFDADEDYQFVETCKDHNLRRRLLREEILTVQSLTRIATAAAESVATQARSIEVGGSSDANQHAADVQLDLDSTTDGSGFLFAVQPDMAGRIFMDIEGCKIPMVLDTGAIVNTLNANNWRRIRKRSPNVILQPTDVRAFAYASNTPLTFLGQVDLVCSINGISDTLTFVVVEGRDPCLLGRKPCVAFKLVEFLPVHESEVRHVRASLANPGDIIRSHKDIFTGLGCFKGPKIHIEVDDTVSPMAQPIRRLPFHLRANVEAEIVRLVKADVIERVFDAPSWLSPLRPVPMKDGAIRLCLQSIRVNKAIVKHRYPMPLVDDVLVDIPEGAILSELDFNEAFHQLPLDDKSKELTAFATESGVYRFKRLICGLSVATQVFQQIVQQTLAGLDGVRSMCNNVLVFGKDQESHDRHLHSVLRVLASNGFTLNPKTCTFSVSKLIFMGYLISDKGLTIGEDKIKAVLDMPPPQSPTEVRSFLGLANFSTKFVPNLATTSEPMRRLLLKNAIWSWGGEQEAAFAAIKRTIADSARLSFYSRKRETALIVDASPVGLGVILVQRNKANEFVPIAFASRALSTQERKYSQTEKEALAVIWGCERFRLYLIGIRFSIYMDHQPLQVIYSATSIPSARIERWALRLQEYDFTLHCVKGEDNAADSLSRLIRVNKDSGSGRFQVWTDQYLSFIIDNAIPKDMSMKQLCAATAKDEQIQLVRQSLEKSGRWERVRVKDFKAIKDELSLSKGLLLRGSCIVIPLALRYGILQLAHATHQGIVRTKALLREKVWWPGIDRDIEKLVAKCKACQLVGLKPPPNPLSMTVWARDVWENVAIDVGGPFPCGNFLVVVVDYFSKWPEILITRDTSSGRIIKWLAHIFDTHGFPMILTCDDESNFVSKEFRDFLHECDIIHHPVPPYWPQANGLVERMNGTILKSIGANLTLGFNLTEAVRRFIRAYRNTPQHNTPLSPAQIMLGRVPKFDRPQLRIPRQDTMTRAIRKAHEDARKIQKDYADNRQISNDTIWTNRRP